MFRLVLVSALVAIAAGAPKIRPVVPMLDGRIVGGEPADISEFPYQLSLLSYGNHICGASVLSANRVLTAAHCTYGSSAARLSIRAGSSRLGQDGQVVQVSKISQHPQYNPRNVDYDVSVLVLEHPLELGSNVQPVDLHPIDEELASGTLAVVSGWGSLSVGGFPALDLQKVEVPKVSDEACKRAYGADSITARMTCHGYARGGKDSCQGDSGGPLVANGQQVGIVSWGYGCASARFPGVYAKVANREIQNHIQQSL